MHEYPLAQRIIEICAEHGAKKVKTIHLVVGESSGIVADSILLYFDIISKGTVCENAKIEIETIRPMLQCEACGRLFKRKPFSFDCQCGGEGRPTEIGREFYVKSIEE